MKKHFHLSTIIGLFLCLVIASFNLQAQRSTIAGWTFPALSSYSNVIAADCGAGTLYADGTNGSDEWTVVSGGSTPGIYFNNTGTAPAENLCEETATTKSITAIGGANNGKSWVFAVSTSGMTNIQMSYNHRRSGTGFKNETWSHSTDGVNFTEDTTIVNTATGSNTSFAVVQSFQLSEDADDQATLYVKVTFSDIDSTSTGNYRLDNFRLSGESNIPTAAQPVFSANGGNLCQPINVEITCETANASIYYTTDGTTPDNVNGTLYTGAVNISSTTTLKAIAYAEGLQNSAVKSADFTFPTDYATIAAFKASNVNDFVRLTGDLTVLDVEDPSNTQHYVFVQDATAATCLFQSTSMGTFSNGDVISGGVCGTTATYNGMLEVKNPDLQGATVNAGTPIAPATITIAELNSNYDQYECRLVTVTNATFGEGSFTTSINSGADLIQGNDTVFVANQFRTVDNYTVPTANCNVTGVLMDHSGEYRICPRGTEDIEVIETSVTIITPVEGQVFEQGDPIYITTETNFFDFDNNNTMQVVLTQNGALLNQTVLHSAAELTTFEQTDYSTNVSAVGTYYLIVNLKDGANNVLASDNVSFQLTTSYVAIETSESELTFSQTGESHTFAVSGIHLTSGITLAIEDTNFVVTPTTLAATAENETVTVTFVGTASATAQLTLTSDTVTTIVTLNAEIPIDEVIYTTGFEATEGFVSTNSYNNDNPAYFGPTGQQWSTYHGTVTATTGERMFGEQVMQMRYYASTASSNQHLGHIGYVTTNFDLHNVTKVEFFAKNNGVLNLTVSCSFDGGNTFEGETDYAITSSASKYTYTVSDSGQHYCNRLRFTVALPEEYGTGTYKLTLDSVVVYGVTGLEPSIVETPTISEPTNSYITPITVTLDCATEGAQIYYTTDGTDPDTTSTLYTAPFTVSSTCTLKARGFKGGMDPSFIAFAEYTFPTEVATIAAFKAAGEADNTATYKITGDVTFVYRNGRRIFIEDATGGLLVYDESEPIVTGTYAEGDVVNGIIGTYTVYNGMTEMIPAADWAAASGNVTVTPAIATANGIRTDFAAWESRLVRINDVTFLAGAEFDGSGYTEVDFEDATAQLLLRDQFKALDTTIEEGANADIIGFVAIYDNGSDVTYQIFPRSNADILEIDTTAIAHYTAASLRVYPNPAQESICIESDAAGGQLQIVNAFGQVIYRNQNPVYPLNINLSQNASGLYFVRIISANQQITVTKFSKL